jgi:Holliday junction resolvase RusA-like endonuclease
MVPLEEPLTIVVRGKPEPRGSKQPFVLYRDKAKKVPVRRPDGGIVVNMADDNPQSKAWMKKVEAAAVAAWRDQGLPPVEGVGIAVDCTFFLERPAGQFGTGRNARLVKDSAPARPRVRPDLDKLARGTLDALTGVVWWDDSCLTKVSLDKAYAVPVGPEDDGQGVLIVVRRHVEQDATDLPAEARQRWLPTADPEPGSLLV